MFGGHVTWRGPCDLEAHLTSQSKCVIFHTVRVENSLRLSFMRKFTFIIFQGHVTKLNTVSLQCKTFAPICVIYGFPKSRNLNLYIHHRGTVSLRWLDLQDCFHLFTWLFLFLAHLILIVDTFKILVNKGKPTIRFTRIFW